jgi:predicted transcriptional regulator
MVGVIGVIDMELLSVIRRWHHRDRIPIREIERRTGLSRNTICKYLRGIVKLAGRKLARAAYHR